jgi:DNA-binding NtrC family response regulator
MPTTTILIAHRDLGIVFWIGQRLDRAGYRAFPANSSASAESVVSQFHLEIDLLILDASIPGIRSFAKRLRLSQGHLKTIVVVDEGDGPGSGLPKADAVMRKPGFLDDASEIEWLETIERVFAQDSAQNARAGTP